MRRQFLLPLALLAILPLAACTRLTVNSQPSGATVLWSPDGLDDWRPWPPVAWSSQGTGNAETPLKETGRYGDAVWITVQKDGFYRPLPQVVQLYPLRRENLVFELKETPEALGERMRAEGRVFYGGEWVEPGSVGLVEYEGVWLPETEAFFRSQRAKGLVDYEGQWVTLEERNASFAADQRAKGLELFKDRWVTAEVRGQEEAIDAFVKNLSSQPTILLTPPKVIGRVESETAQIQILNATGRPIRFILSGPMSRDYMLKPYESHGITGTNRIALPAGRYVVAAISQPVDAETLTLPSDIEAPALLPGLSEQPLAAGFQYLFSYDGGKNLNVGDLENYQFQEPEMPYDLPSIEIPDVQIPERSNGSRGPGGQGGSRGPRGQ